MALDFGDTEPPVDVVVSRDPEFYHALIRDLADLNISFDELERRGRTDDLIDRPLSLWVEARGRVDKDLLRQVAETELGEVVRASTEARNLCSHDPVHQFNQTCDSDGFTRSLLDGHSSTCEVRTIETYRHPVTACDQARKLCLDDPPHTYGQACGDYHDPAV